LEEIPVSESLEQTSLAEMTAEIVSAYVSYNEIATADLAGLITAVADKLGRIGSDPDQPEEAKIEPAVSVRRSIRPDHLLCLVCGKPQKILKRHLAVQHDLTPAEYRERFGLKPDYPMAAPGYSRRRSEMAKRVGLGRRQQARRGRKPRSGE
jgi:predicted transcriptional regulator